MRCKYDGCPNLTHYPNSAICWKKWSLCAVHARFLHPEEYSGKGHLVRIAKVRKGYCTASNYKTRYARFGMDIGDKNDPILQARKLRRANVKFMHDAGKGVPLIARLTGVPKATVWRDLRALKYEQLLSVKTN